MKIKKLYYSLVLIALLGVLLSFSFQQKSNTAKFIIPKGWTEPNYDFKKNPLSKTGIELGKKLFFDPVLSRDQTISCASCHSPSAFFTNNEHAVSHGIDDLVGTRNTLPIFNLAWSKSFNWDGGIDKIELVLLDHILHPEEMDNTIERAVEKIVMSSSSPTYKILFTETYGDSIINPTRIINALTQFTVSLVSCNSRYDRYIRNEPNGEMTEQQLHGLELFRKNCTSCHTEPLLTNNTFENIGLPINKKFNDNGRIDITHNAKDANKFKVPSLRNIAQTNPYMHDGRFTTLEQVLEHYTNGIEKNKTLADELKKPIVLSDSDKKDIIAFLKTLSDIEYLSSIRRMARTKIETNPNHKD